MTLPLPRPSNSAPGSQSVFWVCLGAGGVVAVVIVLAMIVPIVAQQKRQAVYGDIAVARQDGQSLLEKLGSPPGSEPTGFRTTEAGPKERNAWEAGLAWLKWMQPYAATGAFAESAAWYQAKLLEQGWKVHRPADSDATEFCMSEWRLGLARTPRGYDLRLEWNNRLPSEPCTHP